MRRFQFALVFASGCATAALAGWLSSAVHAQDAPTDNVIHVCAAPDGVLHMIQVLAVCPNGQRSLFLRKSGAPKPNEPTPDPDERSADARIKALEQRIAALEADAKRTGVPRRVTAPFEVVDRDGKRVFFVGADNGGWTAALYNAAGAKVARLVAHESGGYFMASNPTGSLVTTIGATTSEANVKVMEAGTLVRAELGSGAQTNGVYRLAFLSKAGKAIARIGEMADGTGAAVVADTNGDVRAAMGVQKGLGNIAAQNSQGIPVAQLTEGSTQGGLLKITSSSGEIMVDAGINPGGFGVVRTGPASFMTAAGLGLPGSYIMGKAK